MSISNLIQTLGNRFLNDGYWLNLDEHSNAYINDNLSSYLEDPASCSEHLLHVIAEYCTPLTHWDDVKLTLELGEGLDSEHFPIGSIISARNENGEILNAQFKKVHRDWFSLLETNVHVTIQDGDL